MNNYEKIILLTEPVAMFRLTPVAAGLSLMLAASPAAAHFQELIPSADIVAPEKSRSVSLHMAFTHPMERGPVMEMAAPARFGVMKDGRKTDLKGALAKKSLNGKTAYTAEYALKEPGDYLFYLEPTAYWEPAEKKYILHYSKVVVDFGGGEDWDAAVGFPVEIQPLTRPYGLWTGNLFRGVVKHNGKPLPGAEIEIEWRNDGSVTAPSDPFITQVIKADAQGVFAYAMPRAGWWAFNAMTDADKPLPGPDGKPAKVEIGGTIWVNAVDMK